MSVADGFKPRRIARRSNTVLSNASAVSLPKSAQPRRLLLLSTAIGMGGGAEEQVIQLATSFHARGWPTLIVSMLPPSKMPPGFEQSGIPVAHLGMKRGLPDPRAMFRLARVIREFRPDVVHTHMVHANLLARFSRLLSPFPVLVCTHHNVTMAGVEKDWTGIFEIAHRLTDAAVDHSTAICQEAADYYVRRRAAPAHKMSMMPNGIETRRFRPAEGTRARVRSELGLEHEEIWLAAGRLERQKAYPVLLKAFAQSKSKPRTLLICGRGSLHDELKALAQNLGLEKSVRFLGLRSDIPELMAAADAFAMSSDFEGLPLVLLQAAAAELPIVATDVGGNRDVVIHGENGYLVPAGNPEAFAAAMATLSSLPAAERIAMGRAGSARAVTQFEAEAVTDRWQLMFEQLLEGAAGDSGMKPADRGNAAAPQSDGDLGFAR